MYQRIANGKVISLKDGNTPYIYVGTDAGKPTPGVGDFAICTDTGKQYQCAVNGIWSLSSSPAVEEYSNHTGTADNIAFVAVTGNGSTAEDAANHRRTLSTGTLLASSAEYGFLVGAKPSTHNYEFNARARHLVNGTNGTRETYIGMITDAGLDYRGAYFYNVGTVDNGVFVCRSTDDGMAFEDTSVTFSSDDLLTIKGNKNLTLFYVNGALVATHRTITFTAASYCYPTIFIRAADGNTTVAREAACTFMSLKVFL